MQKFVSVNGHFFEADKPVIMHNNRAFCYGDAVFETIRITNSQPQFLKDHFARLRKGMLLFRMQAPEGFNEKYIAGIIADLSEKNGVGTDARARLTIFRNEGGLYTPERNTVSFLLEITDIEEDGYVMNLKGLKVDLFPDFTKQKNILSTIKTPGAAVYVLAGIYKKEHALDDCILLNDNGNIIESISSNLFAVKNGVLYTAPIIDGCVEGIMRRTIMRLAAKNRISVQEVSIMQNVLLAADELFLTNSIKGIQWIGAYKQKRYFNTTSKKIIDLLNDEVAVGIH